MSDSPQSWPLIRTLMTNPCAAVGVGMTCRSILGASVAAGFRAELFTTGIDGESPAGVRMRTVAPSILARLPIAVWRRLAALALHRRYLEDIQQGEIAYLWPSVPLDIYERIAARGVSIVAESVNTRMEVAKPILDAAYAGLGLPPAHGITEKRIAEQNRRQTLCAAIFAPSPATERAFAGTSLAERIIPVSYGTWVPKSLPPRRARPAGAPVVFVFVGTVCVRKGAHLLLEAWRKAPKGARLHLVGEIEPAIRDRFADVLDADTVSHLGFTHDVIGELARSDVMVLPSLEEGDAIATYEAAAQGLPVIASEPGAGRIGAETGAINVVDPTDIEALRTRLADFAASEDLRRHWGMAARAAALSYDWSEVGPRRFTRLFEKLGR